MTCGKLELLDGGHIKGHYKVWGKPRLDFTFVKNADQGDKAPDFIIQAKDPCGDLVDIGKAYENTIKQGDKAGEKCYSVFLNEPGLFRQPLKLSAFPATIGGRELSLDYETEKKQEDATAQQQAA